MTVSKNLLKLRFGAHWNPIKYENMNAFVELENMSACMPGCFIL